MNKDAHKIEFSKVEWHRVGEGVEQKTISRDGKKVRMVRFSHGFVENDWCKAGHIGYVVEGSMTVNFNGTFQTYSAGDALCINSGETSKHKVEMKPNESVTLFLVEDEENEPDSN